MNFILSIDKLRSKMNFVLYKDKLNSKMNFILAKKKAVGQNYKPVFVIQIHAFSIVSNNLLCDLFKFCLNFRVRVPVKKCCFCICRYNTRKEIRTFCFVSLSNITKLNC